MLNREQPVWSNEAWMRKLSALEIGDVKWNGKAVSARARGDLAENQDQHERRSTFPDRKISLREWDDNDLASYRFAHAASSSGEFQSRVRTESVRAAPSNGSSATLVFNRTAKS